MSHRHILALGVCFASFSAGFSQQGKPFGPPKSEGALGALLDFLPKRQLGPTNMGGRIMDLAVLESNPDTYYVATASSGLWRTTNGGDTFEAIFDYGNSVSMGAVAICQSKPNVIYVGTGEQSSRNSVAWGDGVYKSVDGGKTWAHIGLTETRHISEIYVDPKNPNNVWVAAVGRLWGRSNERGIYKSTDGGKTWRMVFTRGDRAGIIDLDVDPKNPRVMYACAWDRLRKPYVMASGGLESGIFKSTDGGETWRPLTRGLPNTVLGRCSISIHDRNPNILIATVEYKPLPDAKDPFQREQQEEEEMEASQGGQANPPAKAEPKKQEPKKKEDPNAWRKTTPDLSQMNGGGMFISRNAGESWEFVRMFNPRPFYFSNPAIDPVNPNRIYSGGLNLARTDDLGKTWVNAGASTHADHHVMWINPKNPNHIITGCDGGVYSTKDAGKAWRHHNQMPLGQFYAVDADNQVPYWVYGGLQDNGCWALPTQTDKGFVGPWDAQSLNGGDGFYVLVDPKEPEYVYAESQGGNGVRLNRKTGERRSLVRGDTIPGETQRRNWNTPMMLSPHDNKTIYIGTHRLLKSTNRGDSFVAISPDLTTMSPRKIKSGELSKRTSINIESTGAENHCTVVTLDESRLVPGRLATGSDDGLVNISLDGGANWTDITANLPGLPANTWISRVLWSKWSKDRLYVTADGHRNNDFRSYVYVSEDAGKTFRSLAGSLPDYDSVYVIREGEKNSDLLFLGSEMSLRVSTDLGKTWQRIRSDFPTVAVHDLKIQSTMNDLVVGTHGRSIWTIDIAPLEALPKGFEADSTDRAPKETIGLGTSPAISMPMVFGTPLDGNSFGGSLNNQPAARLYFWNPKPLDEKVDITATFEGEGIPEQSIALFDNVKTQLRKAGFVRYNWQQRGGGNRLKPGTYKVRFKFGDKVVTQDVQVLAPKSY